MLPSTQRLELFTDAVIAIAITLLVLQLVPPHFPDESIAGAWRELQAVRSDFFSFIFSFAVLSIFWVNHHQFFTRLRASSRRLLWSNLIFTFWMSLIPFPTGLLGANPKNVLAVMLYGLTVFMGAISFLFMQWLARDMMKPEFKPAHRKLLIRRAAIGPLLYGTAVLLAPLSVYFAYAIFVLGPLYYFIPWRMHQYLIEEK